MKQLSIFSTKYTGKVTYVNNLLIVWCKYCHIKYYKMYVHESVVAPALSCININYLKERMNSSCCGNLLFDSDTITAFFVGLSNFNITYALDATFSDNWHNLNSDE